MRLKELRKNRGVSQEQVAHHLGISLRGYQNYEYGLREPNIGMILKLAEYYNVTTDYLLEKDTTSPLDPFENLIFTKEMKTTMNADYKKLLPQDKAVIARIVKALVDSHSKNENDEYIIQTTTVGAEMDRMEAEQARKIADAKAKKNAVSITRRIKKEK